MNAVPHLLHLLRCDLRRLRAALAIWVVVVAAATTVAAIRPMAVAQPSLAEPLGVAAGLLWLTTLLLGFALISFVVHADPAVGTDAFWMTRPIPGLSLAGAKLLLLAIALVVLPEIGQVVLLAINRMPWAASAGVIADSLAFRVPLIAVSILAAALTRNLARYALLCGGALLALVAALAIVLAVEMGRIDDSIAATAEPNGESAASLIVFAVLLVSGVLAAIAVQYVTRLRRRSVAVAAGAAGLAYALSAIWPIDFLRPHVIVPDWAQQPAALALSVDAGSISTNVRRQYFSESAPRWSTVNGAVRLAPPERAWMVRLALREAAVTLPNGTTLRSPGTWSSTVLSGADGSALTEYARLRDVLDVDVIANVESAMPDEDQRPDNLPVLFLMPRDQSAALAGARAHYRGRFRVQLTHLTIDGVLPIQAGALHQNGPYRFAIDRVIARDGEAALAAREAQARSAWDRRPWSHYRFYLRHRARRQAVEVDDYTMHSASLFRYLPFGDFGVGVPAPFGFSSRGLLLGVPPRYAPRREALAIDAAWLAGAELVILRQTQEGSVERSIEMDDFPL